MKNLNEFYRILNINTPVEAYMPLLNIPITSNIRLAARIFSCLKKKNNLKSKIDSVRSTLNLMGENHKKYESLSEYLYGLERSNEKNIENISRLRGYLDMNHANVEEMFKELGKLGLNKEIHSLYTVGSENYELMVRYVEIPKSYYIKAYAPESE